MPANLLSIQNALNQIAGTTDLTSQEAANLIANAIAAINNYTFTLSDSAGASRFRIENSNGTRIFEILSNGDSWMDFRIHDSPFNEIYNGSFEEWDSASSPWAWGTLGGAVLAQETGAANKRLGTYSCKVTTATLGDAIIQYTPRYDNEGINVTTSLCYKKLSGSANLWLAAYDTTSGTVYSEMELDSVADEKTIDFGGSWFRPRLTYAPNGSGHQIGIKIYQKTSGNAVYYLDEVQTHEGDGEYAWIDTAIVAGHDQTFASNKTFRVDHKQYFRDASQYINSDAAGSLSIVSSIIKLVGALNLQYSTQNANFTVGAASHYSVDASSGNITVSFPNASGLEGRMYLIMKTSGSNNVILDGFGSQQVGFDTTLNLTKAFDFALVVSDHGQWRIISSNVGPANVSAETQTASFTAGQAASYLCDATAGAITVSFATASGFNGRRYTFTKTDASVNAVILDALGGQTFNGKSHSGTTITLAARYDSVTIEAQGGQWQIISDEIA